MSRFIEPHTHYCISDAYCSCHMHDVIEPEQLGGVVTMMGDDWLLADLSRATVDASERVF